MTKKKATVIGAGVGVQYGLNAARLASARGKTGHSTVGAAGAGAVVGAATGAGTHTLYTHVHPHFRNGANKITAATHRLKAKPRTRI